MAGLARSVIQSTAQAMGLRLYGVLPRGVDLLYDVDHDLPNTPMELILDVGAHVGESAARFHRRYPEAQIHCFEPSSANFQQLHFRLARSPGVHLHNMAMGAVAGPGELMVGRGPGNRLANGESATDDGEQSITTETVRIGTIDQFCADAGIRSISFLKIDTEGADLDVLEGASGMIDDGRIDMIQLEAGISPENRLHVPLEQFRSSLEKRGYRLFGFYEQVREWMIEHAHLRRVNPVFVSPAALAQNRHRDVPGAWKIRSTAVIWLSRKYLR